MEENKHEYAATICPKCLNAYRIYKPGHCDECGTEMITFVYATKEEWEQRPKEIDELRMAVKHYGLLDEGLVKKLKADIQRANDEASGIHHCPQCDSVAWMPVRRNWSPLARFATELIDMVCTKCGYVWRK